MEEEMKCPHCGKTIQIDNGKPTAPAPAEKEIKAIELQKKELADLQAEMALREREIVREEEKIACERKEMACREQEIMVLRDALNERHQMLCELQKEVAKLEAVIKARVENKP